VPSVLRGPFALKGSLSSSPERGISLSRGGVLPPREEYTGELQPFRKTSGPQSCVGTARCEPLTPIGNRTAKGKKMLATVTAGSDRRGGRSPFPSPRCPRGKGGARAPKTWKGVLLN